MTMVLPSEVVQGDRFTCYRECPELCDRCREIAAQALTDRAAHKFGTQVVYDDGTER